MPLPGSVWLLRRGTTPPHTGLLLGAPWERRVLRYEPGNGPRPTVNL